MAGLFAALVLIGCGADESGPPAPSAPSDSASTALDSRAAPASRCSLVMITIDTLRADRLGCYGYFRDTSPNLDALARESILFERTVTTMATTLPVHVSLMTSTHPGRHGVQDNFTYFQTPDETATIRTLAQMLSLQGYQTAAFVSAQVLSKATGMASGFDGFDQPPGPGPSRKAHRTIDRVLEWLSVPPTRLFFLWVHLWDPHLPYNPPEEYRDFFDPEEPALARHLDAQGFPDAESFQRQFGSHFPGQSREQVNSLYDGEIRHTDREIGRLLARLRELGIYDEVALVVTADHGEGLGQHSWIDHGRIYNEQIYVPLIMRFPHRDDLRGVRMSGLASIVDVVPTLVATLDLPLDPSSRAQLEGFDLVGNPDRRRHAFTERVDSPRQWEPGRKYALTGTDWKYFHRPELPDELYALGTDATELHNVIADHPDQAERMRRRIEQILRSHRSASGLTTHDELTEEQLAALKALGYLQGR